MRGGTQMCGWVRTVVHTISLANVHLSFSAEVRSPTAGRSGLVAGAWTFFLGAASADMVEELTRTRNKDPQQGHKNTPTASHISRYARTREEGGADTAHIHTAQDMIITKRSTTHTTTNNNKMCRHAGWGCVQAKVREKNVLPTLYGDNPWEAGREENNGNRKTWLTPAHVIVTH
jgi:hypothetical protein